MFNEEERQVYEVRLKEFADVASIIASGAEKNIEIGKEIGKEIGMEIGKEKASKAIVLNMAGKGIDTNTIAEFTGLSMSDIAAFLQGRGEQ